MYKKMRVLNAYPVNIFGLLLGACSIWLEMKSGHVNEKMKKKKNEPTHINDNEKYIR